MVPSPRRGPTGSTLPLGMAVPWEARGVAFRESLRAYFGGPKPAPGDAVNAYLRDALVRGYWPGRSVVASVLWHIATIGLLLLPIWTFAQPSVRLAPVRIEVAWFNAERDLPPIALDGPASKPSPRGDPTKPLPRRGADAFHPRQTIISDPAHPTHPRQTLIQPDAPPEPPKITPPLPNIVEWTPSMRPALRLSPSALGPLRRRHRNSRLGEPPPPDIQNAEKNPGPLSIAASPEINLAPRLAVNPSATPQFPTHPRQEPIVAPELGAASGDPATRQLDFAADAKKDPDVKMPMSSEAGPRVDSPKQTDVGPAPDIASPVDADTSSRRIIAISATPVAPPPDLKIPSGNLAARVTMSPEGTQPGVPGGSPNGTLNATGGAGGGPDSQGGTGGAGGTKPGPGGGGQGTNGIGVSITGGRADFSSGMSGPGGNGGPSGTTLATGGARNNSLALPGRSIAIPPPEPFNPSRIQPVLSTEQIAHGTKPEAILGAKRVYTIYVNMPNLTSAAGSWVLNFAELDMQEGPLRDGGDVSSPVPIRKVDPKYPPALMSQHVEGEVVLYGIIRRDGTVDSIQVLKSIDPQLDDYAMRALARWKFRPATRNGTPIELETVVHIPFRLAMPY